MENKFKSIWNSWVDWLGLPSLSPCLFVFQLQEGSGSCWPNRYLFCLPLQTSWRGSHCSCSEMGQTWNSCVLSVPRKSKSALVPSPSNMFYNLLPWCGVLCVFFFNHYFHWTTVQVLYSPSGLWRCNLPWAAKVRLVGSGWGMRIILDWIGRRLTAERRARCSVK